MNPNYRYARLFFLICAIVAELLAVFVAIGDLHGTWAPAFLPLGIVFFAAAFLPAAP